MGDNPRKYQSSSHREGKNLILHDFKFDLKQPHRQQSMSIKSNRRSMPNLSISKRQSFQESEQFPEKKLPPINKIQTILFNPSQQKQETQTRKLKQPPIRRNKTLNKKIEIPERTIETMEEALSKHETSKKIFYIKNLALDSNIEEVQPKKNTLVKMKQQQVNRKTNNLRKFFKQITNTPSQLITYTMNYTSTNSFKRKQFQPLKFEQKSHRKPKKNEEEHLVDGWNIRTSNGDMFEHLYNIETKKTA